MVDSEIPCWCAVTFYREGSKVKWHDGTIVVAKKDTCCSVEDWYDPEKVDKYGRLMEKSDA